MFIKSWFQPWIAHWHSVVHTGCPLAAQYIRYWFCLRSSSCFGTPGTQGSAIWGDQNCFRMTCSLQTGPRRAMQRCLLEERVHQERPVAVSAQCFIRALLHEPLSSVSAVRCCLGWGPFVHSSCGEDVPRLAWRLPVKSWCSSLLWQLRSVQPPVWSSSGR